MKGLAHPHRCLQLFWLIRLLCVELNWKFHEAPKLYPHSCQFISQHGRIILLEGPEQILAVQDCT